MNYFLYVSKISLFVFALYSHSASAGLDTSSYNYHCEPNNVERIIRGVGRSTLQSDSIQNLNLRIQIFYMRSMNVQIAEDMGNQGYQPKRKPVFALFGEYNVQGLFPNAVSKRRGLDIHLMQLVPKNQIKEFGKKQNDITRYNIIARMLGISPGTSRKMATLNQGYYMGGTWENEDQLNLPTLVRNLTEHTPFKVTNDPFAILSQSQSSYIFLTTPVSFSQLNAEPETFKATLRIQENDSSLGPLAGFENFQIDASLTCYKTQDLDFEQTASLFSHSKTMLEGTRTSLGELIDQGRLQYTSEEDYHYEHDSSVSTRSRNDASQLTEEIVQIVTDGQIQTVPAILLLESLNIIRGINFEVTPEGVIFATGATTVVAIALRYNPWTVGVSALLPTAALAATYCNRFESEAGLNYLMSLSLDNQFGEVKNCPELAGQIVQAAENFYN